MTPSPSPTPPREHASRLREGTHGLKVDKVSKSFGGVKALTEVSLEATVGRITGIIGPNGAGKSTLFSVITGTLRPDTGRVTIGGQELTGMAPHLIAQRGVGHIFQTARGFPSLSILENLLVAPDDDAQGIVPSLLGHTTKPETVERAMTILERIKLLRKVHVPYAGLSGGETRLLEIGRQLMREPRYILLDEPTAGVTPAFQGPMADLLLSLREEAKVLLCVEHNMRFLKRIADEVAVLVRGAVVTSGPADQVFQHPEVVEAYLGKRGMNA